MTQKLVWKSQHRIDIFVSTLNIFLSRMYTPIIADNIIVLCIASYCYIYQYQECWSQLHYGIIIPQAQPKLS